MAGCRHMGHEAGGRKAGQLQRREGCGGGTGVNGERNLFQHTLFEKAMLLFSNLSVT